MTLIALREGVRAIDDVLDFVGLSIAKADPSPLTRQGFDRLAAALALAMQAPAAGVLQRAIDNATDVLDRDWPNLSLEQRETVFGQASKLIFERWGAAASAIAAPVTPHVRGVMAATRQATARRHALSIPDVFSARDLSASQFAGVSTGFYVRTKGGAIIAGAADRSARGVVARAIEEGWSKKDTAKEMRKALVGSTARTEQAYLEMVSSVAIARARSFSTLRSFTDAGITTYRIAAVLDEVTSDICRFMHNRVFQVEQTLQRYAEVQAAPPGDVAELQPWLRQGRTPGGERTLYVQTSAGRAPVANVVQSAVGQIDQTGEFRARMSDAKLQAMGACCPPFHGNCRTIVVPGSTRVHSIPRASVQTVQPIAAPKPQRPRAPRTPKPPPVIAPPPLPPPMAPAPAVAVPPPARSLLRQGVHFDAMVTSVSKARADVFLEDVSEPWVLDALAKIPLKVLRLERKTNDKNGWYALRNARQLAVNFGRAKETWGSTLAPGQTWSISQTGKDKGAALKRTFVHELGHHIHLHDEMGRGRAFTDVDDVVKSAKSRSKGALTRYADKNRLEYFAEAFAAYVFEPMQLKAHDPIAFRMVQNVLALRGLKVP